MSFMDYDETVKQVEKLLPLLPGVEVMDIYEDEPLGAKFTLAVRSQGSLVLLVLIAQASNSEVIVSIDTPGDWDQGPESLRYVLYAFDEPESLAEGFLPPSILQKVGIYLARELKYLRLLDAKEADRLQRGWNADPR